MLGNVPDCVQTGGNAAVTGVTSGSTRGKPDGLDHRHSAAARGARVRVQKFGTFLSNMIMPNIGAIIAWGLITALFIPDGLDPRTTTDRATMVWPRRSTFSAAGS